LKNTLLDVAQNFDKMSDLEKAKANDKIRENVKEIMKSHPKTEREKELDRLAKEEKEEYERNKNAFYADPIHWNNNKRRRHGLSVLRGDINKYRSKIYPAFHPSVKFFGLWDDIITETLVDKFKNNEYFNSFVEVKDLAVGDANVFKVGE
jgi:hypothetical protein